MAAKKTTSTSTSSQKKLVKSKKDKIIAGVLGGVSSYLSVDPTIVRLVYVALVAFTGFVPGIIAYAVAALILPEE